MPGDTNHELTKSFYTRPKVGAVCRLGAVDRWVEYMIKRSESTDLR
jgi:hypothetical protein